MTKAPTTTHMSEQEMARTNGYGMRRDKRRIARVAIANRRGTRVERIADLQRGIPHCLTRSPVPMKPHCVPVVWRAHSVPHVRDILGGDAFTVVHEPVIFRV